MKTHITIGSRGSDLALWQARHVQDLLQSLDLTSEIKIIKTQGDNVQDLSFDKMEGKGFFTKEIEEELLAGTIDLAVHSHKDLPTESPAGLSIACVPLREDPSEWLLIRKEAHDPTLVLELKKDAIVGTGSVRRRSQLKTFRDDLEIRDLRGNVPTRVKKLMDGMYDAILIAAAGMRRLQLDTSDLILHRIEPRIFIPAPAQGALALQIRENDTELAELLLKLQDANTFACITAEREVLKAFDGGCQLPLGAHCVNEESQFNMWVSYAPKGTEYPIRVSKSGNNPSQLAADCVAHLKNIKPQKIYISREKETIPFISRSLEQNNFPTDLHTCIQTEEVKIINLPDADWVFFSSPNAVRFFLGQYPQVKQGTRMAAIGGGTAKALREYGYKASFVGSNEDVLDTAIEFSRLVDGSVVLFPCSEISLRAVQLNMQERTKVIDLVVYKTKPAESISKTDANILVFTSPSNVDAYFDEHKLEEHQHVIAMGRSTGAKLQEKGISKFSLPDRTDEYGLLDAIYNLS